MEFFSQVGEFGVDCFAGKVKGKGEVEIAFWGGGGVGD